MSVTLKKEIIQTSDVICQKYNRTTVESDVIVPDINPDILKVLDVSGYVTITEKNIRSGKVYIQGTVNMTVLYAPDGEVFSSVKSLSSTQEFNHTVDAADSDGTENLSVEVEPENFNYTLINSRKISLRCTVGANVKLTRCRETELASGVASGENICVNTKKIRVSNTTVSSENRIVICEQFELSSDRPSISELLKTTVFPESTEFTLMENKAVAKGQVRICTLYISADDGSVQSFEHTLPFSEVLDVDGAEEDMEGEIDYSISDIYCEVRDDSDGEPRIIGIDLGLGTLIRGMRIQEFDVICDAYSLDGNVSLTTEPTAIEQLVDNTTSQMTHKSTVTLPEALPEIAQICDLSTSASVDRITVSNGEITVTGSIKNTILYMTRDDSMPLCSFTDTSEFSHSMPAPGVSENSVCDAKVFIEHTSYTMNGANSVDLRIILGLSVRSFITENISPVIGLEVTEESSPGKKPCITFYFVRSGDTLWNIAKRYHTTVDALKECNNLSSDLLNIGQQIRICR